MPHQPPLSKTARLLHRPSRQTFSSLFTTTPPTVPLRSNVPVPSPSLKTTPANPQHDRILNSSLCLLAILLFPTLIWGADAYGTNALKTEATNLQTFLFGPVMRIAGVVGAVFGIVRSFQTQSLQPLFIFGGIGAATVIVPKLLDAMFKVT